MEFTLTINPASHPNAVGELLRKEFFKDDGSAWCTYDWQDDVEELPQEEVECDPLDPDESFYWHRGKKNDIECRWFWDHDGTLEFLFPDGSFLVNSDCKKDYRWEYYPAGE